MNLIGNQKIKVKFLHRSSYSDHANQLWIRQFPGKIPLWGKCQFIFDPDSRVYDWLVVYHDMPSQRPGEREKAYEKLACNPANTLHVNYEPSSITIYGHHYLRQFKHLLTSHEPDCVRHEGRIYSQPGLPWFYGRSTSGGGSLSFDEISRLGPRQKKYELSTVCSKKRMLHTNHRLRYKFTKRLKEDFKSMEIFGYDSKRMDDKAQALDEFKYHLAIENHISPHHWTEKLADCYLGYCVPIYAGCTNISEYFPEESYITINPFHYEDTVSVIREKLNSNFFTKALPAIIESRNRVLNKYNLFATIDRLIASRNENSLYQSSSCQILSRPRMWVEMPHSRILNFFDKSRTMTKNTLKNIFV